MTCSPENNPLSVDNQYLQFEFFKPPYQPDGVGYAYGPSPSQQEVSIVQYFNYNMNNYRIQFGALVAFDTSDVQLKPTQLTFSKQKDTPRITFYTSFCSLLLTFLACQW